MLHHGAKPVEIGDYVLGDFTPRFGLFLPGGAGDAAGLGLSLRVCRRQLRYRQRKKVRQNKRELMFLSYLGQKQIAREDIKNETSGNGQRARLEPEEKALNGE